MGKVRGWRWMVQALFVIGMISAAELNAKTYVGTIRKTYADRPSTPAAGFQVKICDQSYSCVGTTTTDATGFFRLRGSYNAGTYWLYAWNDAELWGSQYSSVYSVGTFTPPVDNSDIYEWPVGTIYIAPRPLAPQATNPANSGFVYASPCQTTFLWTDGLDSQRRSPSWPVDYILTIVQPTGASFTYAPVTTPSFPLQFQTMSGVWQWSVLARLRVAFIGSAPVYFETRSPTFSFWMPARQPSDCSATFNEAAFVSQVAPPATMAPGESRPVSITMRNIGTTPWTEATSHRLGSQNLENNGDWGLGRVYLAPGESVAPGQYKTFSFTATARTTPRVYHFQWQMVQELKEWFGPRSPDVAVTVGGCSTPIAATPGSLPADVVWVEDQIPAGATPAGVWNWDTSQKASGSQSNTEPLAAGLHQHFFYGAPPLAIGGSDKLVAYVLIDPCNPPQEVMLQWNDGTWEHRAYWGQDLIGWGAGNATAHANMGALPATGQWVRLEVPSGTVGLAGASINGMAFTLFGGRAWFDRAGVARGVDSLHAPTNLRYGGFPSRNVLWTPPDNVTPADQVRYDLWLYGPSCPIGCNLQPGAPSWYTIGPSVQGGTYTWKLQAISASRPYSGLVSAPAFTLVQLDLSINRTTFRVNDPDWTITLNSTLVGSSVTLVEDYWNGSQWIEDWRGAIGQVPSNGVLPFVGGAPFFASSFRSHLEAAGSSSNYVNYTVSP